MAVAGDKIIAVGSWEEMLQAAKHWQRLRGYRFACLVLLVLLSIYTLHALHSEWYENYRLISAKTSVRARSVSLADSEARSRISRRPDRAMARNAWWVVKSWSFQQSCTRPWTRSGREPRPTWYFCR